MSRVLPEDELIVSEAPNDRKVFASHPSGPLSACGGVGE